MKRNSFGSKQIGTISNKKLNPTPFVSTGKQSKQVSACLPFHNKNITVKFKSRIHPIQRSRKVYNVAFSKSLPAEDGREDPLPQINVSFDKPLELRKKIIKNPELQVGFNTSHKLNTSRIQDSPLNHSKQIIMVGKLYSPRQSSRCLRSKALIKQDGNQKQMEKSLQRQISIKESRKSGMFKNFLYNQYIKQLKVKHKGIIKLQDYDHKFNSSTNSMEFVQQINEDQKQYTIARKQQKQMHQYQQKPVYIGSIKSQTHFEVLLKNQGQVYVQASPNQIDDSRKINQCQKDCLVNSLAQRYDPLDLMRQYKQQEQDVVLLQYLLGVSRIKQILIQKDKVLKIKFRISQLLFKPIFEDVTQPQIHIFSEIIFKQLIGLKPQLLSIRRFINCVLVTTKYVLSRARDDKIAILRHFDGAFYVGCWKASNQNEGCKHGYGYQYLPNKCIYFGEYKQNQRCGYGLQKKTCGQIYIGEWLDGKKQGWGKIFINDRLSQDGDFEEDHFKTSRLQKDS